MVRSHAWVYASHGKHVKARNSCRGGRIEKKGKRKARQHATLPRSLYCFELSAPLAGLCFNIRVLDFTCIHPPTPNPLPRPAPPKTSPNGRQLSRAQNVEPFPLHLSPHLPPPRNCTPIRPLFSATPSNRVLFNWWDVSARNTHAQFFSPFRLVALHFSTVVSSNWAHEFRRHPSFPRRDRCRFVDHRRR